MQCKSRIGRTASRIRHLIIGWVTTLSLLTGCNGKIFDIDDPGVNTTTDSNATDAPTNTPVDMAAQTANDPIHIAADSETTAAPTAVAEIDAATVSENTDGCVAPSREEYMARFGVTPDDKDLSDPNVVTAKAHTILFIFDKSGSMASEWNDDDGSKWEIARDTMIAAVSPYQQYLSAGAIFFSLADGSNDVAQIDSGKQIDYASATDFLDTWDDNMGMYAADGGTPLMDALETADDAIDLACAEGLLNYPFKVTLITDGMPGYWDSQRGLELIRTWYEHGIPTNVVGMPGSDEATQILSDIAAVGSGGELEVDGTVDESTATTEEIVYTQQSTVTDFETDMMILCE